MKTNDYKDIHVWVGEDLYNFNDIDSLLSFMRLLKSNKETTIGFTYRTQLASMNIEETLDFFDNIEKE